MAKNLKDCFPMLQSREEVLKRIDGDKSLRETYQSWKEGEREAFFDMCTGARGVKMLYDGFFKEVMSPEYAPQRLSDFLSVVLGAAVRVKNVLPNDTTRLTDESSLLVLDIVVEFEDGRIANVEVQKIGYLFPGERSACYSADLLLRQYKRLRDERKKQFSYRDIRTVYTIVLFEHSPEEFHAYPGVYRHCFEQTSDTGLKLKIPQKFVYIALDIFKKKQHNEGEKIHNRLEAWLTFFCRDEPEVILRLIEEYPEFKALYEDVYALCRNVEGLMEIFSKELLEMDRNTVKLMIDRMQEKINTQEETIKEQSQTIQAKNAALEQKNAALEQKDVALEQKDAELEIAKQQMQCQAESFEQRIAELERKLAER
ncbi:PD-(D/E)XK nuclease family transposase [Frisingicoccus sp.]|uniref:PD-(D/E)XK nuclease family transposase n=1 Tax=Frisingicoccus sp. TaxID=1918627 RepID=UPI00399A53DF